jgi:hypothetical protein
MTPDRSSTLTPRLHTYVAVSGQPQTEWLPLGNARSLSSARRAALVALLLRAARLTLAGMFMLCLTILSSIRAGAQTAGGATDQPTGASSWLASSDGIFEIRPFAGAFLPTGAQRTLLKDAVLAGGQLSARLIPQLAVTGTFAWTPNNDQLTPGAPTLDVYQYDLGLEARGAGWFQGEGWDFVPFVGLGGGARTYSYRNLNFSSTTDGDGYGSVGAEVDYGRVGLRVEGRDYISQFRPLGSGLGGGLGGRTTNRNDVGLVGGLSIRL